MSKMKEIAVELEEYLEGKGVNLDEIDDYSDDYILSLAFIGVLNGELCKEAGMALGIDIGGF